MKDLVSDGQSVDLSFFMDFKNKQLLESENPLQEKTKKISDFLESIINQNLKETVLILHLPSLESLAHCLTCSYLELHDAFRLLRQRGYDYEFNHICEAIKVWKSLIKEKGDIL